MAHVVAEPCIKCKYTECAPVCPVSAFREGMVSLVIDPDECIDCGACVGECPVGAIFHEDDLPDKWRDYADLNAKYAPLWPLIDSKKEPLPTAEEFRRIDNKRDHFSPDPFTE